MGSFSAFNFCSWFNCSPLGMAQYKLQPSLATTFLVVLVKRQLCLLCTNLSSDRPAPVIYKSSSKSNASIFFFMLTCHVRERCWWYDSRDWTLLQELHYVFLLCDRWQQRGSLTKWHLKWQCEQSKGVELNSSIWKKWRPLTFISACWMLMETKKWRWAQWSGGFSNHFSNDNSDSESPGVGFDKCSVQAGSSLVKMISQ